jgi:flagellar biosynthesis protein FlhF
MRLKTYFSGTVEAAMALAREELGPDAMLVHSKRASAETRHIGTYEVVFALPEPEPTAPAAPAVRAAAVAADRGGFGEVFASEREPAIRKLMSDLAALRNRIEGMSGSFGGRAEAGERRDGREEELVRQLCAREVDEDVAREVVKAAGGESATVGRLRESIHERIAVDPTLGKAGVSRRVVALAGPPGAGKTTALVKLATRYGLSARRSVHLISTDVFRIGAAEQLRLYASILGISFQTVETPLGLAQALEEQRRKDLVLIDTPGWGRRELPELEELGAYMADDPDIEVHLVLPASNRSVDLARLTSRYAVFGAAKLIFTRLDETECYGAVLNVSCRSGKPISYLCAGEQIPEDLEPATRERITELLAGGIRIESGTAKYVEGAN